MNNLTKIIFSIDSFSIFKRSIALTGWAFCPDELILEMTLSFPSGRSYSLGIPRDPSPDVAAIHGIKATSCRFDTQILITEPDKDFLNAELIILATNNIIHKIKPITRLATNTNNKMTDDFIKLVKNHQPNGQYLEIGSRARSGVVRRNLAPQNWQYTGMDIMEGDNVDVVGDAHELSKLFQSKKFDAVASFSVLEHMLMPWKFIVELNQVLNVGAIGLFTTHQSWPVHDAPWDFWRFSDKAWCSLFNQATGFEIITAEMGEPAYTVAEFCHPVTDFRNQLSYLASAVIFRKITETTLTWPVKVDEIISSEYPTATTKLF